MLRRWAVGPIGHYLRSYGRYLVNRAKRLVWLGHYYKTKCEFLREDDAPWKCLTLSNSKWPTFGIIYLDMPDIK